MTVFGEVQEAPPDAIFGIARAFKADRRKEKVNLGVGVYRTADLQVPVLTTVQEVERELAQSAPSKNYLPIDGDPDYVALTEELLFNERLSHVYGAQTLGATSALRIVGELLRKELGHERIYLPQPTWANHGAIFRSAGLRIDQFSYYDPTRCSLDSETLLAELHQLPKGSAILFHACCHNPTGVDPTDEQWEAILQVTQERALLPIFDCAYQGFGEGLAEDVSGVRRFVTAGLPLMVCYSYSKNLALYAERVGALFVVTGSTQEAERIGSQVRAHARACYSNPALHGALIVKGVLGNSEQRKRWLEELEAMQLRVVEMRRALQAALQTKVAGRNFDFLARQRGLFSFIGLSVQQAERLTREFAIYLPESGRISVTGLNSANLPIVVEALATVMQA